MRVGHVVPRHEGLCEGLAGFEPRRGGGRAEEQTPVSREAVGDADAERQFGADDRQIDLLALGQREQSPSGSAEIDRQDAAPARQCPGFRERR